MKKIGILTFHHTTNFGATLQAFGLQKFITSLGHYVEIIDYRPQVARAFYQKISSQNKLDAFESFMQNNLKLSRIKFLTEDELAEFEFDYDIVISGSDQVWHLFSYRGIDTSFFLDFVPDDVKKISYAASFGDTKLQYLKEASITALQMLLDRYTGILIRDLNSKGIVDAVLGNANSTIVLDPVFLSEFETEFELLNRSAFDLYVDCILIYGEFNQVQIALIRQLAGDEDKKICSLGFSYDFADYNLCELGPIEAIYLIKKAAVVFTNQYHGLLFSIKYEKRFYLFFGKGKENKIGDIVTRYGIVLANELDFNFIESCNYGREKATFLRDINFSQQALTNLINEN